MCTTMHSPVSCTWVTQWAATGIVVMKVFRSASVPAFVFVGRRHENNPNRGALQIPILRPHSSHKGLRLPLHLSETNPFLHDRAGQWITHGAPDPVKAKLSGVSPLQLAIDE